MSKLGWTQGVGMIRVPSTSNACSKCVGKNVLTIPAPIGVFIDPTRMMENTTPARELRVSSTMHGTMQRTGTSDINASAGVTRSWGSPMINENPENTTDAANSANINGRILCLQACDSDLCGTWDDDKISRRKQYAAIIAQPRKKHISEYDRPCGARQNNIKGSGNRTHVSHAGEMYRNSRCRDLRM